MSYGAIENRKDNPSIRVLCSNSRTGILAPGFPAFKYGHYNLVKTHTELPDPDNHIEPPRPMRDR